MMKVVARVLLCSVLLAGGGIIAPEVVAGETTPIGEHAARQMRALLDEKASRTHAQLKIDSALLLELKRRRRDPIFDALPTLQSRVEIEPDGAVLVDIQAKVSDGLLQRIEELGGTVLSAYPRYDAIRARIPMDVLEPLAAAPDVRTIWRADKPVLHAVNTSQGEVAHAVDSARAEYGVDGTGVKVCAMSDSVDHLADVQATDDLPANIDVLPGEGGSDQCPPAPACSGEGTAMLEIVHDLAPGAALGFATAFRSEASFATNILALRNAGCDIIVDDILWSFEWVFQDGIVAQAVNTVTETGVLYFSSAANNGSLTKSTSGVWEGDYVVGVKPAPIGAFGIDAHDFGGLGAGATTNRITKAPGGVIVLKWSDPWVLGGRDYDLFLLDATRTAVIRFSTNAQAALPPLEAISAGANDVGRHLVIVRRSGLLRFLHLNTIGGELERATEGQIFGHAPAEKAFAVAAVDVATAGGSVFAGGASNPTENFSSDGPRRIFYQADGTPITPGDYLDGGGELRQKPDIAAADGVETATPGFNPFFGTSAAAPHAAAIAALLLEANPQATMAEVRAALSSTALDIEATGVDRDSGWGLIMADGALDAITEADLSIGKSDSPDPVVAGTTLTYTVTVSNAGPSHARHVVATDTLPAGVTLVSTSGCEESPGGGVPLCTLGRIVAGAAKGYTITVWVTPPPPNILVNQVSVSSSTHDPDATNNTASQQTIIVANPQDLDFGDAPAPYPTTLSADGARHILSLIHLGGSLDTEADGQPNATATGDDAAGNDDEDGIVFTTAVAVGNAAGVTVTTTAGGRLNSWVDFNRDGDWTDAGEQVFTDELLAVGANPRVFAVPTVAVAGTTFARFRFSTQTGLGISGVAADGEVEDYALEIQGPAPSSSLQFSSSAYGIGEAEGSATIIVTRLGSVAGTVGVSYATLNDTALAGADYLARTGAFTWLGGDASARQFTVPIVDDSEFEGDERLRLVLRNSTGEATIGTPGVAWLTITDDDDADPCQVQVSTLR